MSAYPRQMLQLGIVEKTTIGWNEHLRGPIQFSVLSQRSNLGRTAIVTLPSLHTLCFGESAEEQSYHRSGINTRNVIVRAPTDAGQAWKSVRAQSIMASGVQELLTDWRRGCEVQQKYRQSGTFSSAGNRHARYSTC